ncbi:undecaprenyl-diphosphate phosphatase [Aquibacillus salsiterrae]|uniref:Undecaprenyl-diphosphatase n=1 Tax=Aquibacillus salsiterrae TaxID=2950439 RepID=A0A9X4AFA9_9BACI|nr:undecaprenyl-diphosphate phosphatase [Aquibacillus salsiterrae]MDC3417671.1 undecaprenyl-diphosphate phosphatase [Aquibacillus salsiterrae]
MWELFVAFVLGIVEGLTEFAPVSSTGHMIIFDDMLLHSKALFSQEVANTFKVVIQLGSILAVVIVFRDRFVQILGLKRQSKQKEKLSLLHVLVGIIPASLFGVLFEDYIDQYLFSIKTVLIGLVIGAMLMIAADLLGPKHPPIQSIDQISLKKAFMIGVFQCFALWPGFSRSGSTISGGVLLGVAHRPAADFTFIMAIPIMAGASFISLLKNWEYFTVDTIPFLLVGFISAFIFAMLSIKFFLKLIKQVKLVPFAIYRIVLALIILMMIS